MNDIARHYDEDPLFLIDQEDYWITAKGKSIKIKNMTTLHILNTIRAWEGLGITKVPKGYLGGKRKWIGIFTKELIRRNGK